MGGDRTLYRTVLQTDGQHHWATSSERVGGIEPLVTRMGTWHSTIELYPQRVACTRTYEGSACGPYALFQVCRTDIASDSERVAGIGPAFTEWKSVVLPLDDTRKIRTTETTLGHPPRP